MSMLCFCKGGYAGQNKNFVLHLTVVKLSYRDFEMITSMEQK